MSDEGQPENIFEDVYSGNLLLGAVKLEGTWRVYAGTIGEWTLDYPAYEPESEDAPPEELQYFRSGLLRVDENNAKAFCAAMKEYEVPLDALKRWIEKEGVNNIPLLMLVDFDNRLFVHGYSEPIEPTSNYIPSGWTGIVGNPLYYVSEEIRHLWMS
jgi:hypothetical protein